MIAELPVVYEALVVPARARNQVRALIGEMVPVHIPEVAPGLAPEAIVASTEDGRTTWRFCDDVLLSPIQAPELAFTPGNPLLPLTMRKLLAETPRVHEIGELEKRFRSTEAESRPDAIAAVQRFAASLKMVEGQIYAPSLGPVISLNPGDDGTVKVTVTECDKAPCPAFLLRADQWEQLDEMLKLLGTGVRFLPVNRPEILIEGCQEFDADEMALVQTAKAIFETVPDRYLYNYTVDYLDAYFEYFSTRIKPDEASPELADLIRRIVVDAPNAYLNGNGKQRMQRGLELAQWVSQRLQDSPNPNVRPAGLAALRA